MIGQEPLLKLAPVRFCHGLFLFDVWQEVTEHSIQHVAVRFVGVFRLGCHADIRANVKAYVSAFMNKRGYLIIEYSDQVERSPVSVFS
jgi:hypothetical protein